MNTDKDGGQKEKKKKRKKEKKKKRKKESRRSFDRREAKAPLPSQDHSGPAG